MKIALVLIAVLLFAATFAFAEGKPQTTCPVMGGSVDKKSAYADVEGYRIYVCCGGCVSALKADPATYIKKLKDDGIELEKAPASAEKAE